MAETGDDKAASATTPAPTLSASPTKEKLALLAEAKKDMVDENGCKSLEKKVITKITVEPDEVKVAKRKERFGVADKQLVDAKKSKRAERFGSIEDKKNNTKGGKGKAVIPTTPENEEKKKARAARFGNAEVQVDEKKSARAARFGK